MVVMLLEQNIKGSFYPCLERNDHILGNQWLANSEFFLTLMLNFKRKIKHALHTSYPLHQSHPPPAQQLTNISFFAKARKARNANKVYNVIREVIWALLY